MEYIDGETLVASHFLEASHRLDSAVMSSSFAVSGGPCLGLLMTPHPGCLFAGHGAGPFASYDDFTAWYNHKLDVSRRVKQASVDAPRFDISWPVVLHTHGLVSQEHFIGARRQIVCFGLAEDLGFTLHGSSMQLCLLTGRLSRACGILWCLGFRILFSLYTKTGRGA
ncbi:hypothetical protein BDN67DRAFT_62348 [Paxillus ammoniavirescens]|nr:hypothetical protein BDN67DRAFT_62348 [Paxillus ammoniavirescens]